MQLSYQRAFFSACVHESSEGAVISLWNFREADPRRSDTSLPDTRVGEARAEEPQSGEQDRRSVPQQHVLRRQDCSPRALQYVSSQISGTGCLGVQPVHMSCCALVENAGIHHPIKTALRHAGAPQRPA